MQWNCDNKAGALVNLLLGIPDVGPERASASKGDLYTDVWTIVSNVEDRTVDLALVQREEPQNY
eukprot:5844012-Pyramimonas_sp.AAC.1